MTPEEKAELRERKRVRIDLLNRRSIAWLLEMSLVELAVTPIVAVMTLDISTSNAQPQGIPTGISLIVWGLYSVARDTIGDVSVGKRVMNLALRQQTNDEAPSVSARIQRNIPLVVPFGPAIEFTVLYFSHESQTRLGDRLASTRVVDAAPDRNTRGTHSALLLLSLIGLSVIHSTVVPALVRIYLS